MLKSKYKAFEIQDDKVSETVVEGNLIAIADFIKKLQGGEHYHHPHVGRRAIFNWVVKIIPVL